jgi:hypothetical protein
MSAVSSWMAHPGNEIQERALLTTSGGERLVTKEGDDVVFLTDKRQCFV